MGVPGLTEVVPGHVVDLAQFKGLRVAIDATGVIFRAQAGIGKAGLTNKDGIDTGYLNVVFSEIMRFASYRMSQIWVFDFDVQGAKLALGEEKSSEPNAVATEIGEKHRYMKRHQLAHREAERTKAKQKLDELEASKTLIDDAISLMGEEEKAAFTASLPNYELERTKLEQRLTTLNPQKINTVKQLLDLLGIEWMEAPITYEGEHLCAELNKGGVVDFVFSADTDAIVHGAPFVVRKEGYGKGMKYKCYSQEEIFKTLNINYERLVCIAICLGSDYHDVVDGKMIKPHGIGAKTVLAKYEKVDYTPYMGIYNHFARKCDYSKVTAHNPGGQLTEAGCQAAIDFLVEKFDFNRARLNNRVHKDCGFFSKMEIKRKPRAKKGGAPGVENATIMPVSNELLAAVLNMKM